jgi:ribonuclease Z
MAIKFQVLGKMGRDNALYVTIDSGQKLSRLLFDCGDECLSSLSVSEIQAIDHLLFSHFHMDHVSGFDGFFRLNYDRVNRENHIWGPPRTSEIMQHRFQGFMWNLYEVEKSQWHVHDILGNTVESCRFDSWEAFALAHSMDSKQFQNLLFENADYCVEAYPMNHHTISMAYIVREKPSMNIDTKRLTDLGLTGGSWLQKVKNLDVSGDEIIEINGKSFSVSELRARLLVETQGQSLAYLSDFLMDERAQSILIEALHDCTYMICESQYLSMDSDLAAKNYHMTSKQVAETALKAGVKELILFHISDRYQDNERAEILKEAQAIFPNTRFPKDWNI